MKDFYVSTVQCIHTALFEVIFSLALIPVWVKINDIMWNVKQYNISLFSSKQCCSKGIHIGLRVVCYITIPILLNMLFHGVYTLEEHHKFSKALMHARTKGKSKHRMMILKSTWYECLEVSVNARHACNSPDRETFTPVQFLPSIPLSLHASVCL